MAIRIYPFRPWSFVLPDGTDCSCDTLDEVLYLAANLLKEGEKASITKNSHIAYLERIKTVEEFKQQQAKEPIVSSAKEPVRTVTVGQV